MESFRFTYGETQIVGTGLVVEERQAWGFCDVISFLR